MNVYVVKKNVLFKLILFMTVLCILLVYYGNRKQTQNDQREISKEIPKLSVQDGESRLPPKSDLLKLKHSKLAALYHGYISNLQLSCEHIIRLGEETDGGWDICDDSQSRPYKPCLVYSFGIANDFSFDDAVVENYDCEVHSFDPSMKMKEVMRKKNSWFHPFAIGHETQLLRGNSWPMYTLADLKIKLNHESQTLTILKFDVEEWEMLALPEMISSDSLKYVKQLLIEFHITLRPEPNKQRYIQGLSVLIDLYNLGFRIFWTKRNLFCKFTSREDDIERTGCHEVSFVNINLIKSL